MICQRRSSEKIYFLILTTAMLLICVFVSAAPAAELSIPAVTGIKGEVVKLHVSVDKVDNLAGIKLAITYDKNILKFC